jgi:hypothetical protein
MPTNRRKSRQIALVTLTLLASLALVPSAQAGPISDMLALHRQNKQMKLPPMEKPFSNKPHKDPNVRNVSVTDRLKKRFSFKKPTPSGVIPLKDDLGSMRTSR